MDRILKLDRDGHVAGALQEHKRLVMSLLDDEYLSGFFWQEPSAERGKTSAEGRRTMPRPGTSSSDGP